MAARGPFDLVFLMAEILDELDIPYALGGSMASSLLGEPRSTVDVDMAVRLAPGVGEALLGRVGADFYVPVESARQAIQSHTSFYLLDLASALKVDLFVVGDGLLDRMQIQRRVLVAIPDASRSIWVTAPEDQVLRKLDWFQQSGSVSDRQWRDVVGILRIHRDAMDLAYLGASADVLGLTDDLEEALRQAEGRRTGSG